MALARWKDLVIDVANAERSGVFWSTVLGLRRDVLDDGDALLAGETPERSIWLNVVPEPKTVKNRVHIDLRARSLQPLLDAGARVLRPEGEDGIRWTVMADPEGSEFCVFVRADHPAAPPATPYEIVVNTATSESSRALADWWAGVLGARSVDDGRGFWWVQDVAGLPFESIDVTPVPEPKTVKNRVHWDVVCGDVPALVARGARVLREPTAQDGWHVLADPQGNEFCAFPADRP